MRLKGHTRLSFTNVLATIALFIALGGTSYAAVKISGKNIKDNTVTSADIKNYTLKKGDFGKGLFESSQAAPLNSVAYEAERKTGPVTVPAGSDYTPVASINLAPGAYSIFAKTDLSSDQVDASHCKLTGGPKGDTSARGLRSNSTPEAQNLQVALTLGAPGTVTLSCKTSDGTWSATDTKILAIKVDTEQG